MFDAEFETKVKNSNASRKVFTLTFYFQFSAGSISQKCGFYKKEAFIGEELIKKISGHWVGGFVGIWHSSGGGRLLE